MRHTRRLLLASAAVACLAASSLPSVSAAPTLPAPPPPVWPSSGSTVPEGIDAIQVVLSGGQGGGSTVACTVTATYRVSAGETIGWILGAGGSAGTASSGGVEPGGAGGSGAYGYDGAAGGDSSTFGGALSGGGGGGASAFEINGATRIVAGGSGGAVSGWNPSGWGANGCFENGTSWGDGMTGGGVPRASSMSDVIAGGAGGTVTGQPGPPGAAGTGSTGVGAGHGGVGGVDGASTQWSLGGGGGGGGGFAGAGGGVGASLGSSAAPGGSGGNMVIPGAAGDAATTFTDGPGSTVAINWVHLPGGDLAGAVAGASYSHRLVATFGGTGATSAIATGAGAWQIVSGALPPGLALNARTGVVSGKASRTGTYDFTISAAQMVWQLESGRFVPRPAARSQAAYTMSVSTNPTPERKKQHVSGVHAPRDLSRVTGTVLLANRTVTSAGQPVRLRVRAMPLVRSAPAGGVQLVRVVTGANGSKTLYITTSQRISVTVTFFADAAPGYRKWSLTRSYSA